MKRSTIIRLVVYSITLVLPVFSAFTCSGWDAGGGVVDECLIDLPFFHKAANFAYGVLFLSSFFAFIPIAIYVVFIVGITEKVADLV